MLKKRKLPFEAFVSLIMQLAEEKSGIKPIVGSSELRLGETFYDLKELYMGYFSSDTTMEQFLIPLEIAFADKTKIEKTETEDRFNDLFYVLFKVAPFYLIVVFIICLK